MKVCVTGASGRAGRAVVTDLIAHEHRVVATDLVAPAGHDLGAAVLRADLTDFGQAIEVLTGCDAVIHLANILAPGLRTRRRYLQFEHDHELQRVHGGHTGGHWPSRLGIQRDHAWPAI